MARTSGFDTQQLIDELYRLREENRRLTAEVNEQYETVRRLKKKLEVWETYQDGQDDRDKYIAGQIDLFDRILNQVSEKYWFGYSERVAIASTIYKGYCFTDLEDAVRAGYES